MNEQRQTAGLHEEQFSIVRILLDPIPMTVIREYHNPGGLKQKFIFSQF